MTILHISDLHFIKNNAGTNNMREILLHEAEKKVAHLPQGQKLLIVTGDFHNFNDADYTDAAEFLTELVQKMGLRMERDVFVVPGNHDVGNDRVLEPLLHPKDKRWKQHQENTRKAMEKDGVSENNLEERMEAFLPYCNFVKALGIYLDDLADPLYPASVHVRCWHGEKDLNLLHLNTALIYDGHSKGDQLADVAGASAPATWSGTAAERPALALGHNQFYDLSEKTRNQLLPVFLHHKVSAYLCGDAHRTEWDIRERNIIVTDGLTIPNLVCAKSIADQNDDYSEFGFYWLDWDVETNQVNRRFRFWKPEEGPELSTREAKPFPMRGSSPTPPEPSRKAPEPAQDAALRAYLAETLRRTRDAHPSFQLIAVDEIDQKLFPGFQEKEFAQIPARGSVEKGGPVSPVWDIVRKSWEIKPVRNVVIEGEGGIGKTTALFSLCNAEDAKDVPAIYVPMHQLLRKDGTLIGISDYLEGLDKKKYGPQICDLTSVPMGDRPNLLVLLDGFNEVRADKRWEMLRAVNKWFTNHPGVQLVAVSRPMDGLNLGAELAGKPISVTLEPLTPEAVREHLEKYDREIPPESAPIWKDLRYPLFLMLYLKTGALPKTWAGYPLAPKLADSGGALIWNFLQRELMKHDDEDWVLRCAIACEYILPRIAWEMTERYSFVLRKDEAERLVKQAMEEMQFDALPKHLDSLIQTYENMPGRTLGDRPDFSGVDWLQTVLHDCGLLLPYQGGKEDNEKMSRFALMHQNFRDCLAALHLVNLAETAKEEVSEPPPCSPMRRCLRSILSVLHLVNAEEGAQGWLPKLWRRSHDPYVLNYAAELADADTERKLWEAVRTLRPTDNATVCTQLELQKRRGDGRELDFSGMDLRDL
ncbi:MAG: metallophosphoesterase, partial [Oscillospiraceae bacterium]|nr:metallophosphoesterase [Oscillospiraceae bacterium]